MEIKADKRLNGWRTLHLIIMIGMYLFYAYLWADFLFYTGKPGWKGFYIFTMTAMTIPFYFIYYIVLFLIAWLDKDMMFLIQSLVGLLFGIIHLVLVFI